MSVDEFLDEKLGLKKTKKKTSKSPKGSPKREVINPDISEMSEMVRIAWEALSPSIESIFGKIDPKTGKRKWGSKYSSYLIVKMDMERRLKRNETTM